MRYALVIQYDGTEFHGWQRQPRAHSIQQCVEKALSRVADSPIVTTCAGRTDAGVHAAAQVVHFDTDVSRSPSQWLRGCNSLMPATVRVHWADEVGPGFHARYSAVERTYCYRLDVGRVAGTADHRRSWWCRQRLDVAAMRSAAVKLVGERDFSAFRAASCQARTATRFVSQVAISAHGDQLLLTISANAFLHNMVRIMTGVLVDVGAGKHPPEWIDELFLSRDRTLASSTAPANGLCLAAVRYGDPHQVPSQQIVL